jgi:hypothetical protein
VDSLSTWLEGIGLERYGQVFAENGVDLNYADEFAAILGKKPAVATGIPGLPRPTAICVTSIASDPRAPVAQRSIPRTCLMGLREDRIGRGEIGPPPPRDTLRTARVCTQNRRSGTLKYRPMICRKNNHRKPPGTNINLKAETPVRRYDRLETGPFGSLDQNAVRQRRPAHLRSGADIVAREQISQGARHTLVKQNPHLGKAILAARWAAAHKLFTTTYPPNLGIAPRETVARAAPKAESNVATKRLAFDSAPGHWQSVIMPDDTPQNPPRLTAEDVVRRIAAESAFVDDRGGVGIRLQPAIAIVRQYGGQFRERAATRSRPRRPTATGATRQPALLLPVAGAHRKPGGQADELRACESFGAG